MRSLTKSLGMSFIPCYACICPHHAFLQCCPGKRFFARVWAQLIDGIGQFFCEIAYVLIAHRLSGLWRMVRKTSLKFWIDRLFLRLIFFHVFLLTMWLRAL